ncbi:MAG: hypothetical protein KDK11_10315 [Maritimibacter sp.]|nr:hypothetical protein [Maritimibacter sp.]
MNHAPTEEELRAELTAAPVVPIRDGVDAPPPGNSNSGDGNRGTSGGRPRGEIWDGSPVKPLGVRGEIVYFLDAHGQLQGVKRLERETVKKLFSHRIPALCYAFPRYVQDPATKEPVRKPGSFDHDAVGNAMYEAAGECGLFNPEAVRGVGAWQDDDGNLVYHLGDRMIVAGEEGPPRRIGRHIYPAYPAIPGPAPDPGPDPVPEILEALNTWKWSRPDEHPMLALGMLCAQMLGGALDWRPTFWVTAAAGSGKSFLNQLFEYLHGADGLVKSTDATERGVTSALGQSSRPVALDEAEPGKGKATTKEDGLVRLARLASSGGEWLRSSADQTGVKGKVFSTFTFSSILIPGNMSSADLQRLVVLELDRRPADWPKATLTPKTWRARGARLRRRLIDRWPAWRDHLAAWRDTLARHDVTGRDADNWATVVGLAHFALSEEVASPAVRDAWAAKVAWMVAADRPENYDDAQAMMAHLLTRTFPIFRVGEQFTYAQWIAAAAGLPGAPLGILGRDAPGDTVGDENDRLAAERRAEEANRRLAKAGMRVVPSGGGMDAQLVIANGPNEFLEDAFAETEWAAGAWRQSARRVPGAEAVGVRSFAMARQRATEIPLASVPAVAVFPADREPVSPSGVPESDVNGFA